MPNYIETYSKTVTKAFNNLVNDRTKLIESEKYYNCTYRPQAIGLAVPPAMQQLYASIGWGRMYVDSLEERLDIENFRLGKNKTITDRLLEWWQTNGLDEESGLAHLEALIYGRSYITVAAPDVSEGDPASAPLIRAESPMNMTHKVDPRTRKIVYLVRFYKDDDTGLEDRATLLLPNSTVHMVFDSSKWYVEDEIEHNLGEVPGKILRNRERLSRREGQSEITREIRSFIDAASRITMDMNAAAELMALPQRLLFGVDQEEVAGNGSPAEVMEAYMAQIIAFENEQGKAFQFSPAELRNFTEALDMLAKHIASYTGLPPQYLSFTSENPASADAIKASESRLVKKAERKSRNFGGVWEDVMRLATLIMDGSVPEEMNRLETVWRDPSTPTYAAKADAATKLYGNGDGVIPRERAQQDIGYSQEERDEMKEMFANQPVARLASILGTGTNSPSDTRS